MTITLCRYHYDPLDRLAACSPAGMDSVQRFYQQSRLATEIQGQIQRTVFQTQDHLLAQHRGANGCALIATDQQRSVLHGLDATQEQAVAYAPYGARHPQADPLGLLGFTGERVDPVTGHYLLGNAYRAFNPVLMRFNSPDSLSPFGEGGLNAYAYCAGDPVNRVDRNGETWTWVKTLLRAVKVMKPNKVNAVTIKQLKIYNDFDSTFSTITTYSAEGPHSAARTPSIASTTASADSTSLQSHGTEPSSDSISFSTINSSDSVSTNIASGVLNQTFRRSRTYLPPPSNRSSGSTYPRSSIYSIDSEQSTSNGISLAPQNLVQQVVSIRQLNPKKGKAALVHSSLPSMFTPH